ncbi:hypothetical protein [Cryobacterium luteum]|uniref:Uncharacterized protein n=1 Tax=Cryobacterium luteum TaxID=1424661 RepID=A0A1H8C7T0_9MICO|nr:hypothetical protein [Cryobacterium luteum]TFB89283.1 hypothetical protein E3O10_10435 [Cryobacterium luteum]SEM91090.1 Transcriptional regulator, AbiEi antitoxin, Type IV TA system [Cryobacterium luteum]
MTLAFAAAHLSLAAITRADGLLLRSEAVAVGLEQELRRDFSQKRIFRLRHGVYMSTILWSTLKHDARYLARIRAYAAISSEAPVFSHHSAAAIWGLPRPVDWPTDVHVTVPQASGGRSRHGIVRHTVEHQPRVVERAGLLVAPVSETAIEMARILPFSDAVAMMDRAIHIPRWGDSLATRAELESALESLNGPARVKGRGAALRAAEFASTQSGSGGESISRANIFLLGFAAPELQVRFDDAAGFIAFVDFFWRTINKVGEFDGLGKYLKDEYTRGLTTAQVVMAEKDREDPVRALGPTFARWDWKIARDLIVFGRFLTGHGIPRAR